MTDPEKIELAVLTERVDTWIKGTNDYRKALCGKLDKIEQKLDRYPCGAHDERIKNCEQKSKDTQAWLIGLGMIVMSALVGKLMGRL